jgi:hypothetical protein
MVLFIAFHPLELSEVGCCPAVVELTNATCAGVSYFNTILDYESRSKGLDYTGNIRKCAATSMSYDHIMARWCYIL